MTNTCKDEWLVAIEALQDGKNRTQKATRKKENKNDLVCGQYIGCKMKFGQDLKPIKVDVSNN
jgi:hypothetical protein